MTIQQQFAQEKERERSLSRQVCASYGVCQLKLLLLFQSVAILLCISFMDRWQGLIF